MRPLSLLLLASALVAPAGASPIGPPASTSGGTLIATWNGINSFTKGGFTPFSSAATVSKILVSASLFTCSANPVVTLYECGTSTTCASPTTMGSATLSAAGTAVTGTISSAGIAAGDNIAWGLSSGTCSSLNFTATASTAVN